MTHAQTPPCGRTVASHGPKMKADCDCPRCGHHVYDRSQDHRNAGGTVMLGARQCVNNRPRADEYPWPTGA